VALGTVAACIQDLIARRLLLQVQGQREVVDLQQLVALWVQAYVDVLRPKLTERRFQVRAATKPEMWERLGEVLAKHHVRWALTGADAAERRTNYFHAEDTEIYAPIAAFEDRNVLQRLVAQPAARAGNLLVIEPPAPTAAPDAAMEGRPRLDLDPRDFDFRERGDDRRPDPGRAGQTPGNVLATVRTLARAPARLLDSVVALPFDGQLSERRPAATHTSGPSSDLDARPDARAGRRQPGRRSSAPAPTPSVSTGPTATARTGSS
jgi:hypothetical protein